MRKNNLKLNIIPDNINNSAKEIVDFVREMARGLLVSPEVGVTSTCPHEYLHLIKRSTCLYLLTYQLRNHWKKYNRHHLPLSSLHRLWLLFNFMSHSSINIYLCFVLFTNTWKIIQPYKNILSPIPAYISNVYIFLDGKNRYR